MKQKRQYSRRRFLRTASAISAGMLVSFTGTGFLSACSRNDDKNSLQAGILATEWKEQPDLEVILRAVKAEQQIFQGSKTRVWKYEGEVVQGDKESLQAIPDSYLGPIFRVKKGQWVRVNLINEVDEETIIHWHGLHLSEEMDGHPKYVIQPGESYQYDFTVLNRAGTYWYHPHPHALTGPQVFRGLAGLFLVSDEEEQQAGLPSGEYDMPLVLQDRVVDGNNQWVYLSGGQMERMMGVLGDQILVNGQPNFELPAAASPYRLRILNGSNSRIYKLAWEDETPLTVIGTDGGLIERAVERPYMMLSPGERVELWADFSGKRPGESIRLVSRPFSAGMTGGMMGGMMGGRNSLANGAPFTILEVKIDREASGERSALPGQLAVIERYRVEDAVNGNRPRTFTLGMGGMRMGRGMMGGGMTWTINGRSFEMEKVAQDEIVQLNTQEAWVYDNLSRGGGMGMMGGMMQMAHPMHIHGVQFQVIERQADADFSRDYETVREGFVDDGWKDTVLVMPGERVKLLVRFEHFPGLYLQHCHNLEHEDLGMMRNYKVIE
jgi:blue copper oxidase